MSRRHKRPLAVIIAALLVAVVVMSSDDSNADTTQAIQPTPIAATDYKQDVQNQRLADEQLAWDRLDAELLDRWLAGIERAEAEQRAAEARWRAEQARKAAAARPAVSNAGNGRCGGSLPPCSVMMCESGGNIRAENPSSSASGKWQIVDGTWDGYGGYSHASHAPEHVQDERARQIYAGGAGRSHWVC